MEYKVFGCKTNKYFAEKWMVHPSMMEKHWVFIASCVVTDQAKSKWLRYAKRVLRKLSWDEKLYLSGCGNLRDGQVDPRFYEIYSELAEYQEKIELLPEDPDDLISGEDRSQRDRQEKIRSLSRLKWSMLFTRKYMVIQTGCDNFCTFCLTVQARGRHKWRPQNEIIEEIREYIAWGGQEVVFTGTNLWAWGSDSSNDYQSSRLVELIRSVLTETTLPRLRISSLGVEFCTPELIELFRETRINAYIHLSIQSGSSTILRSMNRHYDGDRVREVLRQIRTVKREDGVEINIWADLIVWFPGESEKDFFDTIDIVEIFAITQLHAFAFSPHVDHYTVPAGAFGGQLSEREKSSRLDQLLEAGRWELSQFRERNLWKTFLLLIEKTDGVSTFSGWTENYIAWSEQNMQSLDPKTPLKRGALIRVVYLGGERNISIVSDERE